MFKCKDDPRYIPVGGRMRVKYVVESRDDKIIDHIEEIETTGKTVYPDWSAKSVPVRELPSGRRTIRTESGS